MYAILDDVKDLSSAEDVLDSSIAEEDPSIAQTEAPAQVDLYSYQIVINKSNKATH